MTLYLDTSSLVKLYVAEPGSDEVGRLVQSATIVATSAIAYTEARAAFARRRREGVLRPQALTAVKKALDADWSRYLVVEVSSVLCRQAGDLAEKYRLRAFDSIHLAAYEEMARSAGPRACKFSSFDAVLNRAAERLNRTLTRA